MIADSLMEIYYGSSYLILNLMLFIIRTAITMIDYDSQFELLNLNKALGFVYARGILSQMFLAMLVKIPKLQYRNTTFLIHFIIIAASCLYGMWKIKTIFK